MAEKAKYTESELKDRWIGKPFASGVGPEGDKWKTKKLVYKTEGVWNAFSTLRDSFRQLLRNADGFNIAEPAHNAAQTMMDAFLIRRSRGQDVTVPKQVVPINAAPASEKVELFDSEDFSDETNVTANQQIQWVSENMNKAGVNKKDAPSYGTYRMLQHYQGSTARREKFYDVLFPKLMTKEDVEKGGTLADTGKDAIELIERLIAALPAEGEE